ncbi:hypothetical protein [Nocardiopsis ansamitocini]|uniref:Uncharacterized protein n=1 Tax=Nocardiopsis ansamitocini TaxID=1670832 RepID=A0A9W6UIP1_9ACTN|nr:hypothetical protein [Nocardiopsis ansamitocini]GLU50131.1 hypothetical protein Nans01_44820 [Nocardiopsis ansamitocini]
MTSPQHPRPVTASDIADFLTDVQTRAARTDLTPTDNLAFFQRKADLMDRIAHESPDPDAIRVAANARAQLTAARARINGEGF